MAWFGVRSVFVFGRKSDGTNIFEERVVCFEAESVDAAHTKAKLEAEAYAAQNGYEACPVRDAYEQDGDQLIDGYEVWSILLESRDSLDEFLVNRYIKYDYAPE